MARRKPIKDDVEVFFEYGLYVPTRTIIMEGSPFDMMPGVDDHMWKRLTAALEILEHSPRGENQNPDITIEMNNPGGDAYHMFAIYDRIRDCESPVVIVASGYVMSAATIIFQAADRRLMRENATMMLHYGSDFFEGHSKDFKEWAKESDRICTRMEDIYLAKIHKKHPKFSRSHLKKMISFDKFMTAQEAVDLGLADEVIPPKE